MEDYGMLDKEGNPTPKAIEIYITHCEKIATTGSTDLPFICYQGKPDPNAAKINLRDRKNYKSFYDNWVYGAYAKALRSINVESNIALPLFDPFALASKLPGLEAPQIPSFESLLALMVSMGAIQPANIQIALLACKVEVPKLPEYIPQVLDLIVPPIPPIPAIPIPSIEFPNISYDIPDFNLLDMQLRIYTALPKVFLELVTDFSNPFTLLQIITKGPDGFFEIFSSACKVLNKALPPQPGGENSSSSAVYQAAIAASLAKPMGVTVLGSLIGSSSKGVVGSLGYLEPDAPKQPVEEVIKSPEEKNLNEVPSEWVTLASGNRTVQPSRTRLAGEDAKSSIIRGWNIVFGEEPPESAVNILLAQFALETSYGSDMFNYNFGGVKGTSPAGLTTGYNTFEVIKGEKINMRDYFRAYRSADEGAWDWISFLQEKFPLALEKAKEGDPKGYVKKLKDRGYFTADLDLYTSAVLIRYNRAREKGAAAIGWQG